MKALIFGLTAFVGATLLAAETNAVDAIPPGMTPHQFVVRKHGGLLQKPGTGKGVILIANEQRRVALAELEKPVKYLRKYTNLNIDIKDTQPSKDRLTRDLVKKSGANMLILLKDDPNFASTLLVAPDDAWAAVNVAALAADKPKHEVLAFRLRKEISRAFSFLCGGVNSQYQLTPANHCSSLADLDKIDMDEVPADLIMRFKTYVEGYGVTPIVTSTYEHACKRGWAPAPTNDIQKAIWDKVRAIPTKPMKIEFNPKTDK